MKYLSILLLTALIISSCEKNALNNNYDDGKEERLKYTNASACGVKKPILELEWLSDKINQMESIPNKVEESIYLANYKGSTVFYTMITDPRCDIVFYIELLNCKGEVVKVFEANDWDEFSDNVTNIVKIYVCQAEI